jgi:Protein ChrB, N-terminal
VRETEWVLLAYRMPREPSTPRIAVWRKLRKLGALQLVDGFVALPVDPATVEAFDWLADEVIEAGGEAWTWRARPGSKQQQTALRDRVSAAVVEEYRTLIADAKDAEPSRRTVDRLRRELRAIEARDRFGETERDRARVALERLASRLDAAERETAR